MPVNILVTEDESIVRKDIERSLKKLGYNVVGSADTGEKAISLAKELKPDLALMDIMLKGDMTGIEAASEIKKAIDIPVIFLTAYADESTLNKAKITEPHAYILKPFKEIDIHTSIEMAMHKHGKELELKVETDLLRSLAIPKKDAR
ncbi:MAG: response regulator, partial [Flavobacteriales bacterium]